MENATITAKRTREGQAGARVATFFSLSFRTSLETEYQLATLLFLFEKENIGFAFIPNLWPLILSLSGLPQFAGSNTKNGLIANPKAKQKLRLGLDGFIFTLNNNTNINNFCVLFEFIQKGKY